ncbi:MAG TPA: hypothetical protein VK601_26110 [Kofleriaceae bacterium]|nr:hypothetical protein [Kofleriaceae bacterium]
MALALAVQPHKNGVLRLEMSRGDDRAELAIAVANQTFRGGAFTGRIQSLRKRARGAVPIAVRTLEFPRGRACDKAMGQLINMRGRGAYLDAATLRALVAFQRFLPPFAEDRILAWKLRDRPISSLPAMIEIFDFDRSRVEPPAVGGRRAVSEPGETDGVAEASVDAASEPEGADAAPDGAAAALVADRAGRCSSKPSDAAILPPSTETSAAPPLLAPPSAPKSGSEPVRPGKVRSRSAMEAPGPSSTDGPGSTDASAAPSAAAVAVGTRPSNGTHTRAPIAEPSMLPPIPSPQQLGAREQQRAGRAEPPVPRPAAVPPREIQIGNSTSFEADPILVEPTALLGHVGILDGNGSARLAAAANLVEQLLARGVPAIVLDRTGEMCGYARPDWWQRSDHSSRACRLAERIDVRLFTPGARGGRPLSVAVIPDLSRVPATEHVRTVRLAAEAVAAMLRTGTAAEEAARLAMLTRAIAVLAKRSPPGKLIELIALIDSGADEPAGVSGDDPVRHGLVEDLAALLTDVFTPGAEPLTAATLVGPAADGRTPLALIHTGFLGDGARLRSWVAQLIGAVHREFAQSATSTLHAVLVLDGAEALLPAGAGKPSAKDPLQGLLERAGAAGLGMVLASQRPGDLDYRRCASVDTWFVGKTDEPTLDRMKALFERRPLGHRNLTRLEPGRIVMLRDGGARDVERVPPLVRIEPIEDTELKALAARSHPRAREAGNRTASVGASAQASAK